MSENSKAGTARAEAVFNTPTGKPMNAREFAILVASISNAAAATAKAHAADAGALGSCGRPLVITATDSGFTLAAAPRPKRPQDIEMDFAVRDIDDAALCEVIDTLFDDSRSLESLPHAAQQPLANAARIMAKKRNNFSVTLQQRDIDSREYAGDVAHAEGLISEFKTEKVVVETVKGTYDFDGFKDSSDTIFLMIDGTSYAVAADDVLVKKVAGFIATAIGGPLKLNCVLEETTLTKPGRKPVITRRLLAAERKDTTEVGEQFALMF